MIKTYDLRAYERASLGSAIVEASSYRDRNSTNTAQPKTFTIGSTFGIFFPDTKAREGWLLRNPKTGSFHKSEFPGLVLQNPRGEVYVMDERTGLVSQTEPQGALK